ncbi:hypothetical protein T492DRAFT_844965 [Pavlovales sp. CCMP2436]|nr:hypothetical protein T492DRAFT_844965 [Pavlovales sp. CCMP2436]
MLFGSPVLAPVLVPVLAPAPAPTPAPALAPALVGAKRPTGRRAMQIGIQAHIKHPLPVAEQQLQSLEDLGQLPPRVQTLPRWQGAVAVKHTDRTDLIVGGLPEAGALALTMETASSDCTVSHEYTLHQLRVAPRTVSVEGPRRGAQLAKLHETHHDGRVCGRPRRSVRGGANQRSDCRTGRVELFEPGSQSAPEAARLKRAFHVGTAAVSGHDDEHLRRLASDSRRLDAQRACEVEAARHVACRCGNAHHLENRLDVSIGHVLRERHLRELKLAASFLALAQSVLSFTLAPRLAGAAKWPASQSSCAQRLRGILPVASSISSVSGPMPTPLCTRPSYCIANAACSSPANSSGSNRQPRRPSPALDPGARGLGSLSAVPTASFGVAEAPLEFAELAWLGQLGGLTELRLFADGQFGREPRLEADSDPNASLLLERRRRKRGRCGYRQRRRLQQAVRAAGYRQKRRQEQIREPELSSIAAFGDEMPPPVENGSIGAASERGQSERGRGGASERLQACASELKRSPVPIDRTPRTRNARQLFDLL